MKFTNLILNNRIEWKIFTRKILFWFQSSELLHQCEEFSQGVLVNSVTLDIEENIDFQRSDFSGVKEFHDVS